MGSNKLTLKFEGTGKNKGAIELAAFAECLSSVMESISRYDKSLSKSGTKTFEYRITKLSYNSPLTVEVEAFPKFRRKPANFQAPVETIKYW